MTPRKAETKLQRPEYLGLSGTEFKRQHNMQYHNRGVAPGKINRDNVAKRLTHLAGAEEKYGNCVGEPG